MLHNISAGLVESNIHMLHNVSGGLVECNIHMLHNISAGLVECNIHMLHNISAGLVECNIAHRRSVAVVWMLYKVNWNPMHWLHGALPVQYIPVLVTSGALVAQRRSYEPPGCRISSQYICQTLWNDMFDPVFDFVGLAGFKSKENHFYWISWWLNFCLLLFFSFSSLFLLVGIVGLGSSDWWGAADLI